MFKSKSKKSVLSPVKKSAIQEDIVLDFKSERAWLDLFVPQREHDPWLSLEEHLLEKSHRDANLERRWKYFGK
jgi:hypothetical protein